LKLSLAILWASVSIKWPLKLDYHTPHPCMVFDRTHRTGGFGISCHASASVRSNAGSISQLINQILSKQFDLDPKLLISMELFASARLESTERTKFIGLVSSLEPLASQEPYNCSQIDDLISSFVAQIDRLQSVPDNVINSITGRAYSLKKESISQAIVRFVKGYFPENPEVIAAVKEAYDIRSRILHKGSFDADLDKKGRLLEDVIRHIYSQILGLDLLFPANIEKAL